MSEACRRSGLSHAALLSLIRTEKVIARRRDDRWQVRTDSLDAWIESCRIEPGTLGGCYTPLAQPGGSPKYFRTSREAVG